MMLQVFDAHYTFELVPMDWLMGPLGLVRNPYDRITHFTVGWFGLKIKSKKCKNMETESLDYGTIRRHQGKVFRHPTFRSDNS